MDEEEQKRKEKYVYKYPGLHYLGKTGFCKIHERALMQERALCMTVR